MILSATHLKRAAVATGTSMVLAVAGCSSDDGTTGSAASTDAAPAAALPQGDRPFEIDPASFTTEIDNPYWPMAVGSKWTYRETDEEGNEQKVVVEVLDETKRIANGIEARVVHDRVTEGGDLVEDTFDWYAQDAKGNVWYVGEATEEYEDGKVVTTAGSWEAGRDGALAGVIVPANPRPGMTYRQEHLAGEAEDRGAVLSVEEQAEVPSGHFTGALLTKDFTPIEPKVLEYKLYARGIGPVLVLTASGGAGREELVKFEPGGG